jgi:hypothetical protein
MSGGEKIAVDLGQLQETSAKVRSDTDNGLRPGLTSVDSMIQHGVPFGTRSPSGEIEAARHTLLETLRIHRANGEAHLSRAEQLGNVLEIIIANYQDADELSRMEHATIAWLIHNALPKDLPRGLRD